MKTWIIATMILTLLSVFGFQSSPFFPLEIPENLAKQIGYQIWQNECQGTIEGLTTWNKGEEFASLGIGHFIWYPTGHRGSFKETFPDIIYFFEKQAIQLPQWLKEAVGCPWKSRDEFYTAIEDPRMQQLRELLSQYVDKQILFMMQRLLKAFPHLHNRVMWQFYRLTQTPAGLYALIDYVNFKGEGLSNREQYKNTGWGLLQVLERMQGYVPGQPAVEEFVLCAKEVLAKRVENAEPNRQENRWLKGWYNRLDTYPHFLAH
jgi:hypothetical protein